MRFEIRSGLRELIGISLERERIDERLAMLGEHALHCDPRAGAGLCVFARRDHELVRGPTAIGDVCCRRWMTSATDQQGDDQDLAHAQSYHAKNVRSATASALGGGNVKRFALMLRHVASLGSVTSVLTDITDPVVSTNRCTLIFAEINVGSLRCARWKHPRNAGCAMSSA